MFVHGNSSTSASASRALPPLIQVVDDEVAMQSLFERIGQLCGFEVAPYGTAESFLRDYDDDRAGCIVIDLLLPDRSGIEVLQEISDRGGKLPVVFISGMARVSEAVQALKLGSVDFVEKPFDIRQISQALRRAVDLDMRRRSQAQDTQDLRDRFGALSPREDQVMQQIVRGAANKEVAASLGLSHKTVEVHRSNVMRKTRAGSLAELVRMHVSLQEFADARTPLVGSPS